MVLSKVTYSEQFKNLYQKDVIWYFAIISMDIQMQDICLHIWLNLITLAIWVEMHINNIKFFQYREQMVYILYFANKQWPHMETDNKQWG